ncbi:MAG: hypothetical protein P8Y36_03050 [Alphaproteobacteria bacterium]
MTGMYQEIEDTTDVVNVAHDFAASMNWTATSFYALILLAIALAPTTAWAKKAWVPPGETKCHGFNFSGWSIDPDPKVTAFYQPFVQEYVKLLDSAQPVFDVLDFVEDGHGESQGAQGLPVAVHHAI